MKRIWVYLLILMGIFSMSWIVWAANLAAGEIDPGEYPAVAITNHTPESYHKNKEYWDSRQNVDLEIGGQEKFRDLPKLGMKQPFTGYILLGDKPQKFGVIVDIVGNEKRLYIDTDGDGSFAGEHWYPVLNEWYGLEIYTVESPEPITLKVSYNSQANATYPIEISVAGLLNKPGPFFKAKPFLSITVRTWFLVKLIEDGSEKMAAVVDRNNNGRYDDPEDAIYVDYNNDSNFSDDEMSIRTKSGVTIKCGKEDRPVLWEAYPDKITIGGKTK